MSVKLKSLSELVTEALSAVAVTDADGKVTLDLSLLPDALKKVPLISSLRVAVLPDGPPDPGRGQ